MDRTVSQLRLKAIVAGFGPGVIMTTIGLSALFLHLLDAIAGQKSPWTFNDMWVGLIGSLMISVGLCLLLVGLIRTKEWFE